MNVLPFEIQVSVIAALTEGVSIRATERLTGAHRDTIMRLGLRIGRACKNLHHHTMTGLSVPVIELDELWAFIGKKQRRLTPDDDQSKGDCYTYLALDRTQKAILSYRSGKRNEYNTDLFVSDLRRRVVGSPMICSDALGSYKDSVRRAFGPDCDYGQVVKTFKGEPAKDAARRYSPGYIVAVQRRRISGQPEPSDISTSLVERQNLNVRMHSRRFTRLTSGFSKKIENHSAALSLTVAHHNFVRAHETIGTTPAVALGLTERPWTIAELIVAAEAAPPMPPAPEDEPVQSYQPNQSYQTVPPRNIKLRLIDGGKKD